jgi:hypothetical protein
MKSLRQIFLMAVVLCFASTPAFAQKEQDVTRQGPCRADIEQFCKNVKPGKGRVLKCMKQYTTHLSTACAAHISEVKEQTAVFKKVCKRDVEKFCRDMEPGAGRVHRCLKEHQADLAVRCADYIR